MADAFKDLIWSALVKAAIAALTKAIPFLGIPVIGPIVALVVGLFADRLYDALKLTLDLKAIAIRNEEHRKAFDVASVKLAILARDKGADSQEYKDARDAHKSALARFVTWA
jgi:hypothetical protein